MSSKDAGLGKKVLFYVVKYYPYLLALGVGVLLFRELPVKASILKDYDIFIDRSLRVLTILLGFFLAMFSILTSSKSRAITWIRDEGQFGRLVAYLKETIVLQFLCILITLVASFMRGWEWEYTMGMRLGVVVFFTSIALALLAAFRFAYVFIDLIAQSEK